MRTIHKYTLKSVPVQEIAVPGLAKFLHFGEQRGRFCLWAEIDSGSAMVSRKFYIFGTGHEMPPSVPAIHLGTVIIDGSQEVYHLYTDHPMTGP